MIKNILFFVGGVVAGATASYIYAKNKAENYINEEIASMKEYNKKQIESYKNEIAKANKMLKLISSAAKEEKGKEEREQMKGEMKVDYSSYSKKEIVNDPFYEEDEIEDEEVDDEEFTEKADKLSVEYNQLNKKHLDKEPFVIYQGEFGDLPINDTQTLLYYTGDDVLTSEDDEIITNINDILGDTLDESGFLDDGRVMSLYVRNMPLNTDYEIVKVNSSFEESKVT